jgi:hypothetical protein
MKPTTESLYMDKLIYVTNSILTELFIQLLENEMEKEYGSITSFLKVNFRYWDSNWVIKNDLLFRADEVIRTYYFTNKQTYPDSLSKVELDITNLYSIARNCNLDYKRFESIRLIRNNCSHSRKITKENFETIHEEIESIIDKSSDIEDDMKLRYKQRINYILTNKDVHQTFYEFYLKLANQDVKCEYNELDRERNDDTKKIDELIKRVAQLEFNLEVKKVEDVQKLNAINQKVEKFEVKLDELDRKQK